jgi:hypothetical protein
MNVFKSLIPALVLSSLIMTGVAFGAVASDKTQSVAGGGVTVKATYLNPKSNDDPSFQIVLDTHSANLDSYELERIAVLRDDTGKSYPPIAIENKGSGHHRQAVVSFPKLSPGVKRIELVIKDVAAVNERTFAWNLE